MSEGNYWSRTLQDRVTRRRALAATGSTALTAALLAACGGGGGSKESGGNKSGLIDKPVDRIKEAKVGGTFKGEIQNDVQTFDPYYSSFGSAMRNARMFSRFLAFKPGILEPADGSLEGDIADSWEIAPDGTTITLKIAQNAHWDPRAPTNGRVVDVQDILYSWNRFKAVGVQAADWDNSKNPGAPIVSMTSPDSKTIVLKLNEPQAGLLALMAGQAGGQYHVLPREAENQFDVRNDARSSGPYLLWEHKPSIGSVYKRNPGFHKPLPFFETMELPLITEYAQALAQFRTGNIHYLTASPIRSADVLPLKRDIPELTLQLAPVSVNSTWILYGWADSPKSPFRDVRIRQALSMAMDRDLFIETLYNISSFTSQGIDMTTRWNTAVEASFDAWWLDPQSKDFGPNAQYYQHNIAEAKKLIAAAGHANGVDVDAHTITTTDYGRDFPGWVEIILGMGREAGINSKVDPVGFTTDWRPKFADVHGKHDGFAFRPRSGAPDIGDQLYSRFNKNGTFYQGFSADGSSSFAGDPQMDDLTLKMRREFDTKKRVQLAYELQRLEAKQQYFPYFPGGANTLKIAWPCVANLGVYNGIAGTGGSGRDELAYYWLDETKAPFKKA